MVIKVTGLNKVNSMLKKAIVTPTESKNALKKAGLYLIGKTKDSIAGRSAEPTSVDTGKFLNSVSMLADKDQVEIWSAVDYAVHLEYGTSKMKARRHFRNTEYREKSNVVKLVEKTLFGGL